MQRTLWSNRSFVLPSCPGRDDRDWPSRSEWTHRANWSCRFWCHRSNRGYRSNRSTGAGRRQWSDRIDWTYGIRASTRDLSWRAVESIGA